MGMRWILRLVGGGTLKTDGRRGRSFERCTLWLGSAVGSGVGGEATWGIGLLII